MKRYIGSKQSRILPDFIANDIADIDFSLLDNLGITAYFFDLDHTVLEQKSSVFNKRLVDQLKKAKVKVYIATNRRQSPELNEIALSFGASGVMSSDKNGLFKPRKKYYKELIKLAGVPPNRILMTGDRIIQDIYGANRLGINTLLVDKLGKVKSLDKIITIPDLLIPILFGKYYVSTKNSRRKNVKN